MNTLDRIISLASLLSLAYFAYGTWQISKSLNRAEFSLIKIYGLIAAELARQKNIRDKIEP